MNLNNRIQNARAALGQTLTIHGDSDPEMQLRALLTDLRLYCDEAGLLFEQCLIQSEDTYEAIMRRAF